MIFSELKYLFIPRPIVPETPIQIVARELNETHIDLLKAQKELEYWQSQVPMLVNRNERLRRLLAMDKDQ